MTDDEALRLWAYQWVTRGEVPDLPKDVSLVLIERSNIAYVNPVPNTYWHETIDLRQFVVQSQDIISTCRVGYGERTKTFVVTPVETQPRYDLATQEAQP